SLSDTQLIEAVDVDLRRFLDIGAPPSLARVYRWPRAMPQYEVGHLQRVAAAEAALIDHPTLALAGAGLRGLGVPDCIRQGQEAADRTLAAVTRAG
ncbi:MAG TPA: FAD-dependent oxidoreductase, partial [Bacillota bacterium]